MFHLPPPPPPRAAKRLTWLSQRHQTIPTTKGASTVGKHAAAASSDEDISSTNGTATLPGYSETRELFVRLSTQLLLDWLEVFFAPSFDWPIPIRRGSLRYPHVYALIVTYSFLPGSSEPVRESHASFPRVVSLLIKS